MKVVYKCVVCGSDDLQKKIGQFAPFIAHRVCDYPICHVTINGTGIFPIFLTNAIKCRACGFVFSQIRFDDDEMGRVYKNYRGEEYAETRNTFEPGYAAINAAIGNHTTEIRTRERAIMEFLSGKVDFAGARKVLDYGGDKGQHIPSVFANCDRYVYDVSNVATIDGVHVVNRLHDVGVMDFVMSCNVLEHLPYPGDAIAAMKGVCADHTRVFIDVPLEMSEHADSTDGEMPSYFHEHINFFTPTSLSALMAAHGFQTLKMEVVSLDFGWTQAKSIYLVAAPNWSD